MEQTPLWPPQWQDRQEVLQHEPWSATSCPGARLLLARITNKTMLCRPYKQHLDSQLSRHGTAIQMPAACRLTVDSQMCLQPILARLVQFMLCSSGSHPEDVADVC